MKTINEKTHYEIAAELVTQVRKGGLDTSDLTEMVWETFERVETQHIQQGGGSGEALFGCEVTVTDINDGGVEMQVPYLLDRGVELRDICGALGLPRDGH